MLTGGEAPICRVTHCENVLTVAVSGSKLADNTINSISKFSESEITRIIALKNLPNAENRMQSKTERRHTNSNRIDCKLGISLNNTVNSRWI